MLGKRSKNSSDFPQNLFLFARWDIENIFLFLGLSPADSFDEALADMITDGAQDLLNGMAKIFYEKDEAKKVLLHVKPYFSTSYYTVRD